MIRCEPYLLSIFSWRFHCQGANELVTKHCEQKRDDPKTLAAANARKTADLISLEYLRHTHTGAHNGDAAARSDAAQSQRRRVVQLQVELNALEAKTKQLNCAYYVAWAAGRSIEFAAHTRRIFDELQLVCVPFSMTHVPFHHLSF